jgi:hypothetical protein
VLTFDGTDTVFDHNWTESATSLFIGTGSGPEGSGQRNVAVGINCLPALTSGLRNVAIGFDAGFVLSSGGSNVFIGHASGFAETTGTNNVGIGANTLLAANGSSSNVAIGFQAGAAITTGTNNVFVGVNAGNALTNASSQTFIGDSAGRSVTTGAGNVLIGAKAGESISIGSNNLFIGSWASHSGTSSNNFCIGISAGNSLTTGGTNMLMGVQAGSALTTELANIFLGFQAGLNATAGAQNTIIGDSTYQAGTGDSNTALGHTALFTGPSSSQNTAIGRRTLLSLTSGANNTALGYGAALLVSTGQHNTVLGWNSAVTLTTGHYNILLGYDTDVSGTAGTTQIVIGYGADATADRQCVLGSAHANGYITEFYLGSGVVRSAPQDVLVTATGGSGTDIGGANFTLAAGRPTGSGAGGEIIFSTAPPGATGTALRALSERMRITDDGFVGMGVAVPVSPLHVQVSSVGTIAPITGTAATIERSGECYLSVFGSSWGGVVFGEAADDFIGGVFYNYGADYLAWYTNNVLHMLLDSTGNLGIGTSSFGASADGVVAIANGTQGGALANTIQLVSEDLSAGNTILSLRTEGSGAVATGTPAAADGAIAIKVNGTVRYLTYSDSAPT